MISSRDLTRIINVAAKAGRDFVVEPGIEVATSVYNLGLPVEQKITCLNDIEHSSLPIAAFVQPLAWPSLVLGVVSGIAIGSVADSLKSTLSSFCLSYNLGLAEEDRIKDEDNRHILRIAGPQAWPGLMTGAVIGTGLGIVADTFRSLASGFTSVYNVGLPDDHRLTWGDLSDDTRHGLRKYGTGIVGLLTGGILGALATTVADTFHTTKSTISTIYHLGLPEAEFNPENLSNDTRPVFRKYVTGVGGILIGGITGIVITTFVDTLCSISNAFVSVYNLSQAEDDKITCLNNLENSGRHWFKKYGIGIAGLLTGGILGAISIVITNTFISSANTFTSIYNSGLPQEDKLTCANELSSNQRSGFEKYGVGIIGLIVGGIAGIVTTLIADTWRSAGNAYTSIYNAGLAEDDKITQPKGLLDDQRAGVKKFAVGIVGIFIGGIVGTVSTFISDTLQSFGSTYISVNNLGWNEEDKIRWAKDLDHDNRHGIKKYGVGLLGVLVGGLLGSVSVIITDNIRSFANTFVSINNAGLSDDEKITSVNGLSNNSRSGFKKYGIGILGLLAGGITGLAYTTIKDTFRSFGNAFASVYNIGLIDEDKMTCSNDFAHDTRSGFKKYGVGILGLLAGGCVGIASTFVIDNLRSFKSSIVSIFNLGLQDQDSITCISDLANDKRHALKKYGVGILGLITGGIAAIPYTFLYDTIQSAIGTFVSFVNQTLPRDSEITGIYGIRSDIRHPVKKYVVGCLGVITGGILGFTVGAIISGARFISNMATGWKSLSGSIMNVALERPIFSGVSATRPAANTILKVARGVGYVAASLTTGIVGTAVYALRKTPTVLLTSLAVLVSPITAIVKSFAACCAQPRFAKKIYERDAIEMAFRELFSSLDYMGKLPIGQKIQKGTDGSKSFGSTVRKCLTFNSKTPTEVTLDAILSAYRRSTVDNFFESDKFTNAVEAVKQEYRNDCFLSKEQIDAFCKEINNVAKFVKRYINGDSKTVRDDFYSRGCNTWTSLFFGVKPADGETKSLLKPAERTALVPM